MSEDLRAELEKYLETLNIQTSCVEHPPVKHRQNNNTTFFKKHTRLLYLFLSMKLLIIA